MILRQAISQDYVLDFGMNKHGTKLRQWALAKTLHFHDKIRTLS